MKTLGQQEKYFANVIDKCIAVRYIIYSSAIVEVRYIGVKYKRLGVIAWTHILKRFMFR